MRRLIVFSFLVMFSLCSFGELENRIPKKEKTYEVVLVGEKVEFLEENISSRLIIRNISDAEIDVIKIYFNFSLVWDGKPYAHDESFDWNGASAILPKTSLNTSISINEYKIPKETLTPGRHTMSLKDEMTESNQLTIFIGKKKDF